MLRLINQRLLAFFMITIAASGCKAFRVMQVQNSSRSSQKLRIVYDKCTESPSKQSEIDYFAKKNKISTLSKSNTDSSCTYEFELLPGQAIEITRLFPSIDENTMQKENEFLYVVKSSDVDTIIQRYGNKFIINHYTSQRTYLIIGSKKYNYEISK